MSDARLKIFISYARSDCAAFAEELLTGLEIAGFDAQLDQHDISGGEDWQARLSKLIQSADTIIFVISPAAASSERCAWEVQHAERHSKRIVPVLALSTTETSPNLKRLNYISFEPGKSFTRALADLTQALRENRDWLREHTRLGDLAARWRARGQAEDLLLRGAELEDAQAWLKAWDGGAPEPTEAQRAFLGVSLKAEAQQFDLERQRLKDISTAQAAREDALKHLSRRTALGLSGAGALTLTSSAFAYWGASAERRFEAERAARQTAQAHSEDDLIRREALRTDITGQLIAFASTTSHAIGDGRSIYTGALLRELAPEDRPLQLALARANANIQTSQRGHRPYVQSSLDGDIYLKISPPARIRNALIVSTNAVPGLPRLGCVERDTALWSELLESCGFGVQVLADKTRSEIMAAATEIAPPTRAGPASNSLGLMFFVGNGFFHDGQNFLLAADTDIRNARAARASAVSVSALSDGLERSAAASVLILNTIPTSLLR
jgi:hypothetical protein